MTIDIKKTRKLLASAELTDMVYANRDHDSCTVGSELDDICDTGDHELSEPRAELISHLVNTAPEMCDRIEELERELCEVAS